VSAQAPGGVEAVQSPEPAAAGGASAFREAVRRYPNIQAVVTVWIVFVVVFALGAAVGWVTRFDQMEAALILAVFALVVAYGQNVVILTGGIDLSVPFAITGTSILLTRLADSSDSALFVILLALGAATLIGVWNGLGVAFLKISPLIMTLATNIILLGLILAYTKGTPKGVAPSALVDFMTGSVGPIKTVLVVGLVFTILGTLLLLNTTFGRYVYAIGNSTEVAYLSGIPVRWVTVAVYAVAGLCYGIAGVMLSGWNEQASFQMGDPYLFPSIAAVVLGGTSILGGRGNFIGTVGGAALFTGIGTVLAGTDVPQSTRNVVIGVILIVAVALIQRERITD
jgi:ribose transport system permease protein